MSEYKNCLYMHTTDDDLELPLAVSDSVKGLSKMTGKSIKSIYRLIAHNYKGWYRIDMEER